MALAQRIGFRRTHHVEFEDAMFAGGWLEPGEKDARAVIAWGNDVRQIRIPTGRSTRLSEARGFGRGGCRADVNADGKPDLVLYEKGEPGKTGRMVWLETPSGELRVADTGADFSDCLPTTMFGKSGVLLIHRHIQIRFYEFPADATAPEPWRYHDIYSIYTPSAQGGLLRYDVDGNGHLDLLAGNYWVQAPAKTQQPWHIFAINKWWEEPRSAMLRLALAPHDDNRFPSLLAAEAEASPARVALFDPPADKKQLWRESPVEAIPPIQKPEAVATADLNGDRLTDLIIGENAGEGSRLLVYWGLPGGKYQGTRIDLTAGLLAIWAYDYDGDGDLDLIGLGPSTFYVWRSQALKVD
ncbi:MAG: VCBS repeat-containing protein [Bryobacterales bacterium]|nr:VCBS repeat-containing protein [Bryobacterales bacterium]